MNENQTNAAPLIVIGENIHTTRVLQRKGPRIATVDGREVIKFATASGEEKTLTIPDSVKKGQDWEQGRVKHVGAVGCSQYNHVLSLFETVHLNQNLV